MQLGLEVTFVTDSSSGKKGLRVWPYIHATEYQKKALVSGAIVMAFLAVIFLLASIAPDPVLRPETVLIP